ncbi:TonB-dependent receptor [Algoriphagus litoralis]|uniref:TonB-dependent receptor n=1 Tax=Algoriphagus litoralis TaxID=2202829 RepID=UPI0018E531EB|nr:TonB-dependent receptor [Algoriphagus litoralis]
MLFIFVPKAYAQEVLMKGQVTDTHGNYLSALIEVKTKSGTRTKFLADQKGLFEVYMAQDEYLIISHSGYIQVELNQAEEGWIKVIMIDSIIELDAALVSGNRVGVGSRESSMSDVIISGGEIRNAQSMTFAGSLENIPGISSMNLGVGVAKPVIRGLSFNRILVNDKGIKQEGQQWGADHGLEIDSHDVDRLEIIKGPNSLMHGPDAMGGVLNILPEQPLQTDGLKAGLSLDYQSNSQYFSQSVHLKGRKDDFYYMGRLTNNTHGDYHVPTDSYVYAGYVLPIFNERLKNTAGKALHFSGTAGKILSRGKSQLTVSRFGQEAGIFTGAVGIPTAYSLEDDGNPRDIGLPRQINTHWKVISNSNWLIGNRSIELDLGYQRNIRQEESLPHVHGVGPTPSGNLALGLDLSTFTANYREVLTVNSQTRLNYGLMAQAMINEYDGFEFLLPAYRSYLAGGYFIVNQTIQDRFHWNAGIRLDGNILSIDEHLQPIYDRLEATGEFDQRNPDMERKALRPSFSGGVSWEIDEFQILKANLGSGLRFPTPIELASNGIHHGNFRHERGNANLIPERSYQVDLAYSWAQEKLSFGITPFASLYRGFIYLAPSGSFSPLPGSSTLWEYKQDDAVFLGGELSAQFQSNFNMDFNLGMDYVWNYNLESQLPLPLTPPFSLLAGFVYHYELRSNLVKNVSFGVDFRHAAAQNRVARNERITPGYQLINLNFSTELTVAGRSLALNLGVKNLTNQFYFNHLSRYRLINIPEPGRNIILGLSIPLTQKNSSDTYEK